MKKFLIKIIFLSIPFIVTLFYFEHDLNKIQNSYNYKRKCLEAQLNSIQVLVLGSSEITYGVNPEYFSLKGFNLSNISQSLYYDKRLVLKYIDKMPKLQFVIINISYFTFGYQIIDGIENWRDYYYTQFWNINFPELNYFDLRRYSKIFLYTPELAFSFIKHTNTVNLINNLETNGYLKIDTLNNNININNDLGRQRVNFHDYYYKESRYKENLNDLESLVNELIKRKIKPVIVTPPVWRTYYKFADKSKLKRNHDVINTICNKYNCKYFDYFTDYRFNKRDFFDNDHLNFLGAKKFSMVINNEILYY